MWILAAARAPQTACLKPTIGQHPNPKIRGQVCPVRADRRSKAVIPQTAQKLPFGANHIPAG